MDTKILETEALDQIKALVARYGYKYAVLNFDKQGGDFFIIKKSFGNSYNYLICQSKGRNVAINKSNVVIPKEYVEDGFLVFVYVKPENKDDTKTYLYDAWDIRSQWQEKENNYVLYVSRDFTKIPENEKFVFNEERSDVIGSLLDSVSRNTNYNDIKSLSESDLYFEFWQKTGGLPSVEYIIDVFDADELFFLSTEKLIFLLCAAVIQNTDNNISLSIDGVFYQLKIIAKERTCAYKFKYGEEYHTNVTFVYHNTWVKDILSDEGKKNGFHIHVGDKEESVDAYVMKNGDYNVVYNTVDNSRKE